MTDQELLEKAARAAGCEYDEMTGCWSRDGIEWEQWEPLEDDGDAFRLAVAVGMTVCTDGAATVSAICEQVRGECQTVNVGSDPLAATRRAIVRAAAAMGAS